jgi:predicted esterase YcpF (UPF0227 family)
MNWFKEDYDVESDSLVIALTSLVYNPITGDIIPGKFEWGNITNKISTTIKFKKLFVKDHDYAWWQTRFEGIEGIGPHEVTKFLKKKIKEANVKKTMIIGSSLGGYGSILFGCLCNIDLSIAIAPQTYLSKYRYKKHNLTKKFNGLNINKEETDLKVILEKYNNNHTIYKIYYGKHNSMDKNYAERISHFSNVELFPLDSSNHKVVKEMRNSGLIEEIVFNFVNGGLL